MQGLSMKITLKGIPIGPSVNQIYKPIRGRFIKSEAGRIYDQKIQIYKIRNHRFLQDIKKLLDGHTLAIDKYFILPKKKLFTKSGEIKQFDVENLLKTTMDGLAKILDIDDKYFRAGICEAIHCENEKDIQLIVNISIHENRDFDQLSKELGLK